MTNTGILKSLILVGILGIVGTYTQVNHGSKLIEEEKTTSLLSDTSFSSCWEGAKEPLSIRYSDYVKSGVSFEREAVEQDDGYPEFHDHPNAEIARKLMRALTPVDLVGYEKVKIGRPRDGGYVVINHKLEEVEVVYTIGVDLDLSFEEHWESLFPNVERFELLDHTIPRLPCLGHKKFAWDKKGLGSGDAEESDDLITFNQIMTKNKDRGKKKLLKIDCEGCEY